MFRIRLWALGLVTVLPVAARADIPTAINNVRFHGCQGAAASGVRLRTNSRLDEAAWRIARGDNLHNAVQRAGYWAETTASVQITNVTDDRDIERIVARRFCAQVSGADLREIGTYRQGADIWLIVAAPFVAPKPRDSARISRRILELTNEARSHARYCGAEAFPAAPALVLQPVLERAAIEHSKDMAAHDYLDHTGRDGSTPADRVTRTGYRWRTIGENLASGVMTPEQAVNGWVGSPHHCENLMSAKFTEMAVAYAVHAGSNGGIFWTQVFGTPR